MQRRHVRVLVLSLGVLGGMQSLIAQQFRVEALPGTVRLPNGLTPADFDGDGALDLAITNEIAPYSGGFAVASRLANGTWGFRGRTGVGRVSSSLALQLVGDRRPELLVSYSTFGAAGTNVYSFDDAMEPTLVGTVQVGGTLVVGHGDGDGAPDLFGFGLGALGWQRSLGGGIFAPPVVAPFTAPIEESDILAGDFSGDGIVDLAVFQRWPTIRLEIYRGDGAGGLLPPIVTALPGATIHSWTPPCAGDLNGDGTLDLVHMGDVFVAAGGGSFTHFANRLPPSAFAIVDFDGDGLADVLGPTPLGFGTIGYVPFRQQPTGMTFVVSGTGLPSLSPDTVPFVVDVDQNGALDVVVLKTQTSQVVLGHVGFAVLPHAPSQVWPYGIGTPGCRGHVPLSANAQPAPGLASFTIVATNVTPHAFGVLLFGAVGMQHPVPEQAFGLGVTTHVELAGSGMQAVAFDADAHGQACLPLPLPPTPFVGQFQAVWFAPFGDGACSPSPFGFVSSNALQIQSF